MKHSLEDTLLPLDAEQLERRQLLAGNVTAVITGAGNLVVNGDSGDNDISVAIDEMGNVTITANDGETIDDSGLVGSQVSGDVRINLKGGNDTVLLEGPAGELPIDDVTMIGGSGNDLMIAGDLYGMSGNVKMTGGSGNDEMVVKYAGLSGDVSMNSGSGEDVVTIYSAYSDDIKINSGGDSDNVTVDSVTTYGKLAVSVASGDNSVFISETSAYEGISVKAGGGADEISIESSYSKYGSDMSVVTGGGDDAVAVLDSNVSGELSVRTGGGADYVGVKYESAATARGGDPGSQFGSLKFVLGGGDDGLIFDGNVYGEGTANGGGGTDYLGNFSIGVIIDDSNFE
jgi:hypothetical protein